MGCNNTATLIAEDSSLASFNFFTPGTPEGGVTNVHFYNKVTYKNIYPNIDLEFFLTPTHKSIKGSGQPIVEYNFIVHPGGNTDDIKMQYKGANKVTLLNNQLVIKVRGGNFTENIPTSYLQNSHKQVLVKYTCNEDSTYSFSISRPSLSEDSETLIIDPLPCLDWGTYYGGLGNGTTYGSGIALDASNNIFITGYTSSFTYIATTGAHQDTLAGRNDVFIAEFNSSGSSLIWGTYYGGTESDQSVGIALDAKDNIYITGSTYSTSGIATTGSYKATFSGTYDGFVAKFNSTGSSLLWGTYYAGESPAGIAVDSSGNAYIMGTTGNSSGVATSGAYHTSLLGTYDAFVAKFNSSGTSLLWGTYYGGTDWEVGLAITVDAGDNVYITGWTESTTNIATPGAYQTSIGGSSDAFIAKLNPSGSSLLWGTYYGGTSYDNGYKMVLDANNNVYIAGLTASPSGIATPGAYKTKLTGSTDAFVAKFNSSGSSLLWGTYYGAGSENAYDIILDLHNNVYITGFTDSDSLIATPNAYQTSRTGSYDAFIAKFNSSGSSLLWGTYYGGIYPEYPYGIAIDANENTYIAGWTGSQSGIATTGAYDTAANANAAFVAKFGCSSVSATASQTNVSCNGACDGTATVNASEGNSPYTYSWAPGGSTNATVSGICAGTYTCTVTDFAQSVTTLSVTITQPSVLNVVTSSSNIPCKGGNNGSVSATASGGTGSYSYSWSDASSQTTSTALGLSAGSYTVTVTDNNGCTATASTTITEPATLLTVNIDSSLNLFCNGGNTGSISAMASSGTGTYTYLWSDPSTQTTPTASGLSAGSYTVTVTDSNGCTATASTSITQPLALSIGIDSLKNITCYGSNNGSTTITTSGGTGSYTYSWSDPGTQTTPTASGLSAGSYTVMVTDSNGCTATTNTIITEPTALSISIDFLKNITCNGKNNGSATITPSGGTGSYTYSWSDPGTQTTPTASGLSAGTYTVTVIDTNGCSSSASISLTEPSALTVSVSATDSLICRGSCTTLNLTPSGGTPSYTYLWSTGQTNATINVCPVSLSTYTVTVTDTNGCNSAPKTVTINVKALPIVTLSAINDTICVNITKDSLMATPPGGTFSGIGVTGASFYPNVAGIGTYTITYTYTDSIGCSNTDSIKIAVSACTGINEVLNQDDVIKLYPNPFSQRININISSTINGIVLINMFNMLGENVSAWKLEQGQHTLDTRGLPSGVYMLQLKTENRLVTRKLVKVN